MKNVLACKVLFFAILAVIVVPATSFGQGLGSRVEVTPASDNIEIITASSRRLTFPYDIPEVMIENPEIITANAISPNEIIVRGLKPGITTLSVMNPSKDLQTVSIHVVVDVRKLERAIQLHYPNSNISAHALQNGVMLKGTVARQAQLSNILLVASEYFPSNIVNEIKVGGSQLVATQVKIYEVSRTKLRTLGIDWAFISPDFSAISSVADLITAAASGVRPTARNQSFTVGVVNNNTSFDMFFEAIERNNIAKLLDEPILVAEHGRPAEFLSGGEVPIPIASGLGTTSIEFRAFGTKLDIVPLIMGEGVVKLEVRAEVSEQANDLSDGTTVPGFRVRRVNTSVSMLAGHTLALAGDFREEIEGENKGIPTLKDSPIWGQMFRRNEDVKNETELVFLLTPRFVGEVDPSLMPPVAPGQLTAQPSNYEFYRNGYIEVPRCIDDCPTQGYFDNRTPDVENLLPKKNQSRESWERQQVELKQRQAMQQELLRLQKEGKLKASESAAKTTRKNGFYYPTSQRSASSQNSFAWPKTRR